MKKYLTLFFCITLLLNGCATTNKTKTVIAMVATGIVAGTIEANINNRSSSFDSHSMAVGLGAAAVSGVASMYFFDDESKKIESERKLEIAKQEIRSLRGEDSESLSKASIAIEKDLPSEYKNIVKPGKWEIYHLNNWVSQSEGTYIHQDKMIRITNPSFQPNKTNEGVSNE